MSRAARVWSRPVLSLLTTMSAVLLLVSPVRSQRPAELAGTVFDAVTRTPVQGAAVSLPLTAETMLTDAAGRFVLRTAVSGSVVLRVERLGYAGRTLRTEVGSGETRWIDVALEPLPFGLPRLEAAAMRAASGTSLDRDAIERSGARTAGDAVAAVAAVVIRSAGPGSPQHASLRGGGSDAVLVLVDGVPLNDPMTGEADLSTISASSIETIQVIPGAQSARFGSRAATGVIVIATRQGESAERRFHLGAGSLGLAEAGAEWGGGRVPAWSAGLGWRTQQGEFTFALPPETGGGQRTRGNADIRVLNARAALHAGVLGGRLDLRASRESVRRGLPGRGFAPTPDARQDADRDLASALWRRAGPNTSVSMALAWSRLNLNHRDDQPPFGLAYDDTTLAHVLDGRAEVERRFDPFVASVGGELRQHRVMASALRAASPEKFLDAGLFAHGELPLASGAGEFRLSATLRADRDGAGQAWYLSRSLTAGWSAGPLAVHVAHRTSFSPPSLGDRYFREGVGIEPNPLLEAERVPGEAEAGVRLAWAGTAGRASLRATAFTGDIDGMIVWAPDFRFVWSPHNTDAKRRGAEAALELEPAGGRMRVAANWAWVRATYDRSDSDDIQIAYRPAHSGSIDVGARLSGVRAGALLRYIGERTTAPARVNTLPGFWTLDLSLEHARSLGAWQAAFGLRIDRALNEKETLIFGYPEPGRTLRLTLSLSPARAAPTLAGVLR